MTIGELAEALGSLSEEVKSLTFPIDFKNPSLDEMEIVNTYNQYLSNGDYATALEYRTSHPELESFIFDANKMNLLQTLVLTIQSAEGTKYDNTKSGAEGTNVQEVLDECFQSVSDGKALVASAITDKRVPTDATATFLQMATNIAKIVLGSGNATAADVLKNKTFTNDDGVEYTGTMTNNGAVSKSITPSTSEQSYIIPKGYHNGSGKVTVNAAPVSLINGTATAADVLSGKTFFSDSYTAKTGTITNSSGTTKSATGTLDATNKRVQLTVPANAYYSTTSKLYIAYSTLATLIGLTAAKIVKGNTILGIAGTAVKASTQLSGTVSQQLHGTHQPSATNNVVFSTPFASAPSVTYVNTSPEATISHFGVTISNITKAGFTWKMTCDLGSWQTASFKWTATAK